MRVLFVNDDETVLQGLQASLRRHRRQWQMRFVRGNKAADAVATEPFDVVITELVFRGGDGLSLLRQIAQSQPGAIRVVLSASADQRGAMEAAQLAHQYLTMPCDPTELIRRIERSEVLRASLSSEGIARLGDLGDLPSPPAVYRELRRCMQDPSTSLCDVARLIERDPATSAKILQLVNSAFFSRMRKVTNIRGAVSILGMDLLQGLVLHQGVVGSLSRRPSGLSLEGESRHGLMVAMVARHLADAAIAGAAFTAGLLHDVGKLLLAEHFGDDYAALLGRADPTEDDLEALESAHLSVTHAQVGAYLLGVWGLPAQVVEAVAWHHRPCAVGRAHLDVVSVVHVANAVVHERPVDPQLVVELGLAQLLPCCRDWFTGLAEVGP